MRRTALVLAVTMSLPLTAASQETTTTIEGVPELAISDLITEPDLWDERRVSVVGELVGDFSPRDDGVWVQINGDIYIESPVAAGGEPLGLNIGIGARIPLGLFESEVIGSPGRYGRIGPIVNLVGTFRHNDPRLTGETFLDVDRVATLEPSQEYETGGADAWLVVGAVLTAIALSIAVVTRRRMEADGV